MSDKAPMFDALARGLVISDDKRLVQTGDTFWVQRVSERKWHYCKYCYRIVPTFLLLEGYLAENDALSVIRGCWECGAGLDLWRGPTNRERSSLDEAPLPVCRECGRWPAVSRSSRRPERCMDCMAGADD